MHDMLTFFLVYYFIGMVVISFMYIQKIVFCMKRNGMDCSFFNYVGRVVFSALVWPYVFAKSWK